MTFWSGCHRSILRWIIPLQLGWDALTLKTGKARREIAVSFISADIKDKIVIQWKIVLAN